MIDSLTSIFLPTVYSKQSRIFDHASQNFPSLYTLPNYKAISTFLGICSSNILFPDTNICISFLSLLQQITTNIAIAAQKDPTILCYSSGSQQPKIKELTELCSGSFMGEFVSLLFPSSRRFLYSLPGPLEARKGPNII